jgi:CheY-like chemotaxis protein/HPt (histidine-containing phosphotransfer) domain-containing protein
MFEGLRVLVVDDNSTHSCVLEELLRDWRLNPTVVRAASDGLMAFQQAIANGEAYSFVIIDAQMPEIDGFALAKRLLANSPNACPVLMMLTSTSQLADAQRCRDLGIAASVVKPFKPSELFSGLKWLYQVGSSNLPPASAISSAGAVVAPPSAGFNILLAEDNPVNQRVASGILEKHGHTVIAVDNGAQALQALKMQQFDLVLMDLQMPEMDGFSATSAIRQLEAISGEHLPIIAMTARAMKGDRECCLEAGMDEYISKPVNSKDLLAMVEKVVRKSQPSVPGAVSAQNASNNGHKQSATIDSQETAADDQLETPQAVDFETLLARVENDTNLAEELVELYLDSSPRLLAEIESGVKQQNAATVRSAAHTLKGALQNLSADTAANVALQLEQLGRRGDLHDAASSLSALKHELERIQLELAEWSKGVTA